MTAFDRGLVDRVAEAMEPVEPRVEPGVTEGMSDLVGVAAKPRRRTGSA